MAPRDDWDDLAALRRAAAEQPVTPRRRANVARVVLLVLIVAFFTTAGYLVFRHRDALTQFISNGVSRNVESKPESSAPAVAKRSPKRGKRIGPEEDSASAAKDSRPEIIEVIPVPFEAEVLTSHGRHRIQGESRIYLLEVRSGKLRLLSPDEADALASANRPADAESTVVLHVHLDVNGNVRAVDVVRGDPALRQRAIDAVRQTQFPPILRNGKPVEGDVTMRFTVGAPRS